MILLSESPINLIIPFSKSFFPSKGSNKFPSLSEYIELIVKSLLKASSFQSFENSTLACLPSVKISFLNVVISKLYLSSWSTTFLKIESALFPFITSLNFSPNESFSKSIFVKKDSSRLFPVRTFLTDFK